MGKAVGVLRGNKLFRLITGPEGSESEPRGASPVGPDTDVLCKERAFLSSTPPTASGHLWLKGQSSGAWGQWGLSLAQGLTGASAVTSSLCRWENHSPERWAEAGEVKKVTHTGVPKQMGFEPALTQ